MMKRTLLSVLTVVAVLVLANVANVELIHYAGGGTVRAEDLA